MSSSFDRFLIRLLSRFLLALFGITIKIYGQERIPRDDSPLVILCNWSATPDPAVLLFSFPVPLAFFAPPKILGHRILGFFSRRQGNIHISEGNYTLDALRAAKASIYRGSRVVFLFENRLLKSLENENQVKFAAQLAHRTKARFIPINIQGTEKALPFGSWVPRIETVRILIGEPEEIPFRDQKHIRRKEIAYISQYFALRMRALGTILSATPPEKAPDFPVSPPSPEKEITPVIS